MCLEILEQGQPHHPGCPEGEAGGNQLSIDDPALERAEPQDSPQGARERELETSGAEELNSIFVGPHEHPCYTRGKTDTRLRTVRPTPAPPLVGTGLPPLFPALPHHRTNHCH